MRFCNTPRTDLRKGEARRLRNRAGSAMFLELRFGANSGGGVKGQRGVCGLKNFRLLEQARRDSCGQPVPERAVSESSACTSAAFRCFGKIRLSYRRLPFAPILRGKAASARARRFRNRAGSAMFLELRFGADNGGGVKGRREVCGFKKPPPVGTGVQGYPWVACAGMGSSRKFRMYFCGVSMFLGKSDFPLVGSLSRRYCREKPHRPARKECAAPPARVKFYD